MKRFGSKKINFRHRQMGVLTLITPIILVLILMFGALILDGARLYLLRERMQSQVSAAATAASEFAQSCGSLSDPGADITSKAEAAATSAGWDGKGTFSVITGVVESKKNSDGDVVNTFYKANSKSANAVAIKYQRQEDISWLLPSLFGKTTLTATAAAGRQVEASVSASGNTLVLGGNLNQKNVLNSLLGVLFNGGKPYGFSPTKLNQLKDVTVRLGDLLGKTGAGGAVNALPVNAKKLAQNLQSVIGVASPLGSMLTDLLNQGGLSGIDVGQVLKITGSGASIPRNAEIPVYSLLTSMAMNALKGTTLQLQNISLSLPGLASVDLKVSISQPPAVIVAPARQDAQGDWLGHLSTADITIQATPDIDPSLVVAGTGVDIDLNLPIKIETGTADVDMVSAECAAGGANQVRFGFDGTTGLASLSANAAANITLKLLGVSIPVTGLTVSISAPNIGGQSFSDVETDWMGLNKPGTQTQSITAGGGLSISDLAVSVTGTPTANSNCGFLGLNCIAASTLNSVLSGLEPALQSSLLASNGPLNQILNNVVNPLLSALGIGLGTVDIQVAGPHQGPVVLLKGVSV